MAMRRTGKLGVLGAIAATHMAVFTSSGWAQTTSKLRRITSADDRAAEACLALIAGAN